MARPSLALDAPVKPSASDYEHDVTHNYGITFQMGDGTEVDSFYYADTNELGRGLHPGPEFRKTIERELRLGQPVPTPPTDKSICQDEAVEEARRRWRESGLRSYNLWVTVGGTSHSDIGGW